MMHPPRTGFVPKCGQQPSTLGGNLGRWQLQGRSRQEFRTGLFGAFSFLEISLCTCRLAAWKPGPPGHVVVAMSVEVHFFFSFFLLLSFLSFNWREGALRAPILSKLQCKKPWIPRFSLLDYLWLHFRVPHLPLRLHLWTFLTSKEPWRPQWREVGLSLQKSSMSARPRWPSWSCGCNKPTWRLSRKH